MAASVLDGSNSTSFVAQSVHSTSEQFASTSPPRTGDKSSNDRTKLLSNINKAGQLMSSKNVMDSSNVPPGTSDDIELSNTTLASKASLDTNSLQSIQSCISETAKSKISNILRDIENFSDLEKLYLYLQLPDGSTNNNEDTNVDTKKRGFASPFGKKADTEVIQTYTWIQSHLEEDSSVSIPKQEVYEDYRQYCEANKFERLCVADFGKAMKHVFPCVKPRRLGQRGNSKYCYSGLRKKMLVDAPELPVLDTSEYKCANDELSEKRVMTFDDMVWRVILDWVERTFHRKFRSNIDLARYLVDTQHIKTELVNAFRNTDLRCRNFVGKTSTTRKKEFPNQITKKVGEKKNSYSCVDNIHNSTFSCNLPQTMNNLRNCLKSNHKSEVNAINSLPPNPLKDESSDTTFLTTHNKLSSKVPMTSTTSAIILFSSNQPAVSTLNTNSTSLTNTDKTTVKYKPIQPKPVNIEPIRLCSDQSDKRRHSVATFNICNNLKIKKESDEIDSTSASDFDKNYKRQIDEKDGFMSKKRHVESSGPISRLTSHDLKVNEIETDALYDYLNPDLNTFDNSNDTNNNSDRFVQIKKLLENTLPNNANGNNSSGANSVGNSYVSPSDKLSFNFAHTAMQSTQGVNFTAQSSGESLSGTNGHGHGQMSHSPSARRHAFGFQPISPRSTPTIPEHAALEFNRFNGCTSGTTMPTNSLACKQVVNVSVGPSQPPSEANSPFVSPRNTPIPFGPISRSRNNSGQANYNYRQTSLQNFDSGVSSISNSPFISPQSTPVPGTRNLSRVRHSSGPCGPINRSQLSNVMSYNRSNSLSPMVSDNGHPFNTNQNYMSSSLFGSNVSNVASIPFDDDFGVKMSSEPATVSIASPFVDTSPFDSCTTLARSLSRQRHFSNPLASAPTVVKCNEPDTFKALLNRSRSVPLSQMFQSYENVSQEDLPSGVTDLMSADDTSCMLPMMTGSNIGISKSYPATPICNESFKLPSMSHLEPGSSLVGDEEITSTLERLLTQSDNMIQSGQDLMVSSAQLSQAGDLSTPENTNDSQPPRPVNHLHVPSPLPPSDRDEFNDLLTMNDSDINVDHFQPLEFRSCDNEFSNITLGNHGYDEDFKF